MISCAELTKRYGAAAVVDRVGFELPRGAVGALLGPNGAGKSTVVRMLTGLLAPTGGTATVAGVPVQVGSLALKRSIGVLPEGLGLFDTLTIEEHLHMAGPLYGLPRAEVARRMDPLLRMLDLYEDRYTFIEHCSYGMKKKTALALALLHNPPALFLDEPFEGIDPVSSHTIRDLLTLASARGVTVLMTSHSLAMVEQCATRFLLIREGKLVLNAARDELPRRLHDLYFELVEAPRREDLAWLGLPRS